MKTTKLLLIAALAAAGTALQAQERRVDDYKRTGSIAPEHAGI